MNLLEVGRGSLNMIGFCGHVYERTGSVMQFGFWTIQPMKKFLIMEQRT
jgi:hypothetical protein